MFDWLSGEAPMWCLVILGFGFGAATMFYLRERNRRRREVRGVIDSPNLDSMGPWLKKLPFGSVVSMNVTLSLPAHMWGTLVDISKKGEDDLNVTASKIVVGSIVHQANEIIEENKAFEAHWDRMMGE